MEHNAHLAYAPGLDQHHLVMSMIGMHGGRIDIERGVGSGTGYGSFTAFFLEVMEVLMSKLGM